MIRDLEVRNPHMAVRKEPLGLEVSREEGRGDRKLKHSCVEKSASTRGQQETTRMPARTEQNQLGKATIHSMG